MSNALRFATVLTIICLLSSCGQKESVATNGTRAVGPARNKLVGETTGVGRFVLRDAASDMVVHADLVGAREISGEVQPDGSTLFRNAYGDGADVLQRETVGGVEDFIVFPQAPATPRVDYQITLTSGVVGLRLVENTLEFLSASGDPRLRVSPPVLRDAGDTLLPAALLLEGCNADRNPAAPWGRPTVPAGAPTCILHVSWDPTLLQYPLVLDPSWGVTQSMGTPRRNHSAVTLADGRVLVVGGEIANGNNNTTRAAEIWNPLSGTWTATGSLPVNNDRTRAALVVLSDGDVLLAGGRRRNGSTWNVEALSHVYHATTGEWIATANNLSFARYAHAAVLLASGKVLLAGGYGSSGTALTTTEIYDPSAIPGGSWASGPAMSSARGDLTLTALADGAIAVGGRTSAAGTTLVSCERYANGVWTSVGSLSTGRAAHAAVRVENDIVVVGGGSALNSAEVFRASDAQWHVIAGQMSNPGLGMTATLVGDTVLVVGGGSGASVSSTASRLHVPTMTWSSAGALSVARAFHAAATASGGRLLVSGGESQSVPLTSAEVYTAAAVGMACSSGSECDSGFCVDGVCCNSSCTASCAACDVAGSVGTCVTIAGSPRGTRTCGTGTCGGSCDGASDSCTFPGSNTTCAEPSCQNGVQAPAAYCDGAGACSPVQQTACGSYTCGADACLTSCQSHSDCIVDRYCVGGACTADDQPPTFLVDVPTHTEAENATGASVTLRILATDNVDGTVAPVCSWGMGQTVPPVGGSWFPMGSTTVVCRASDGRGNQAVTSFEVEVSDTIKPTFGAVLPVSAEAIGPAGTPVLYAAPAAFDVVYGALISDCSPAAGAIFAIGETLVRCTATDGAGNSESTSFVVAVADTTRPVLSGVPILIQVESGPGGAVAVWDITANDTVDGAVAVTCASASGPVSPSLTMFAIGDTLVSCSATDQHENTAIASFSVRVADTEAPALSQIPSDKTLEALDANGAIVMWDLPIAADVADPAPVVECTPAPGSGFALGTHIVVCYGRDLSGNVASASFGVQVVDTTKPVVTQLAPITVEADGPAGSLVAFEAPSASDTVDGALAVQCSPPSGTTFAIGVNSVTCSAEDSHANVGSTQFTVTVRDTRGPDFQSAPQSFTVDTVVNGAPVDWEDPVAIDRVDARVPVSCLPASGEWLPIGQTQVTCTTFDRTGNKNETHFTVTVHDAGAPTFAGVPENMVVEAAGPSGAVVEYGVPTATDVVSGPVQVNCTPRSGSMFALDFTTQVTCDAEDATGNKASAQFTVRVADTRPPSLTIPSSFTREASRATGADVTWGALANDIVDGSIGIVCTPSSGSAFPMGDTPVRCTATDRHGNQREGFLTVTVRDGIPPALPVMSPVTKVAEGPEGAIVTFPAPSVIDPIDGEIIAACAPSSGSAFPIGTTRVECSARDRAGNLAATYFDVTVIPSGLPARTVGLTLLGKGMGAVTDTSGTINCVRALGQSCSYSVSAPSVTLTAQPDGNSQFAGWAGACSVAGMSTQCVLPLDASKQVIAIFEPISYKLTVLVSGGSVVATPNVGLTCTATTCTANVQNTLPVPTSVTLTPQPLPGHEFKSWSGACSGNGACTVEMSALRTVTATFSPLSFLLNVTLQNARGSGVTTAPNVGIDCSSGAACTAQVRNTTPATLVDITPAPAAGMKFVGWAGACSGAAACRVTMNAARYVTAKFEPATYRLEVSTVGYFKGRVYDTMNLGLNCSVTNPAGCVVNVPNTRPAASLVVPLSIQTDADAIFTGWVGACSGTTCDVTMNSDRVVSAKFEPNKYALVMSIGGTGYGTVTGKGTASALNCTRYADAVCRIELENTKPTAQRIELVAAAAPGFVFTGWSSPCSGTGSCFVTMDQTRQMSATFVPLLAP